MPLYSFEGRRPRVHPEAFVAPPATLVGDVTVDIQEDFRATRVNPTAELPEPLPIPEAYKALNRLDGFGRTPADSKDATRPFLQLDGQFFIDREGIIRWTNIECAPGAGETWRRGLRPGP